MTQEKNSNAYTLLHKYSTVAALFWKTDKFVWWLSLRIVFYIQIVDVDLHINVTQLLFVSQFKKNVIKTRQPNLYFLFLYPELPAVGS